MKKNIKHFFLLTALAAGTIHFVNRFINMTADIKNILKSENGNFYDWKNGQIYYTKRGSGSPLLLIHDLNPVSYTHLELWEFLESLRVKAATNKDARIQYKQISLYIQLLSLIHI